MSDYKSERPRRMPDSFRGPRPAAQQRGGQGAFRDAISEAERSRVAPASPQPAPAGPAPERRRITREEYIAEQQALAQQQRTQAELARKADLRYHAQQALAQKGDPNYRNKVPRTPRSRPQSDLADSLDFSGGSLAQQIAIQQWQKADMEQRRLAQEALKRKADAKAGQAQQNRQTQAVLNQRGGAPAGRNPQATLSQKGNFQAGQAQQRRQTQAAITKKPRPRDVSDPHFWDDDVVAVPGPDALQKFGGEIMVPKCTDLMEEYQSRMHYNRLMDAGRLPKDMTLSMYVAVNRRLRNPRSSTVADPPDFRTERQLRMEEQDFLGRQIREDRTVSDDMFKARMRNARWAQEQPEYARRLVEAEKINDLCETLVKTLQEARRTPGKISPEVEKYAHHQFVEIATTGHLRGFSEEFLGSQQITVENYEERFAESEEWPRQGHEYYQLKNYENWRASGGPLDLTPMQEDARRRALHMKDPEVPYVEPGPEPDDWFTAPQYARGEVGTVEPVEPSEHFGQAVPQPAAPSGPRAAYQGDSGHPAVQNAPQPRRQTGSRSVNDMRVAPADPSAQAGFEFTD